VTLLSINAESSAKTIDLPNGYAWQAWENIKSLHSPINHPTKNDLFQRFNHSTLNQARHPPDEWFSELDIIRSTESETFDHSIYNLKPKIYEITLAIVKREMNDTSYVPNLNNLKRDIRQIYTKSKSTTVTTNTSGEMMLAAIQSKGKPKFKNQFKG
jgi:hypothetical protein